MRSWIPKLLTTFSLSLFLSLSVFAKGPTCESLFRGLFDAETMSTNQVMHVAAAVRPHKSHPTSNRSEDKWTVSKSYIQKAIKDLSSSLRKFDIRIEARDRVIDGKKNVTDTIYLTRLAMKIADLKSAGFKVSQKLIKSAEDIILKIRVRKYGTVDTQKAIAFENIHYADFTKDHSFVEVKFENPEHENAIMKPRVYMSDAHIALFGKSAFLENFDQIKRETLQLGPNKVDAETLESAAAMVELLKSSQENGYKFQKLMRNLYERVSYAINFLDKLKKSRFQIQMTVDSFISSIVYDKSPEPKPLNAYAPDVSVVEIKTPLDRVPLQLLKSIAKTAQDVNILAQLREIPGYSNFLIFVRDLKAAHNPAYQEGSGKAFHGRRQYEADQEQNMNTEAP